MIHFPLLLLEVILPFSKDHYAKETLRMMLNGRDTFHNH